MRSGILFPVYRWGLFFITSFAFILLPAVVKSQTVSKHIVIDQFGYLPSARKIAVIKDPAVGFDAADAFTAGPVYAVMNEQGANVFEGQPAAWKYGSLDHSSGDHAWTFDFSALTEPGTYYVLDIENNVKSHSFRIGHSVYNEALRQSVRTFFYQRAGHEKQAPYAQKGWADAASHIGPLQDRNARLFSDRYNASTERDLHGGWYDAGDYNKYSSWTAQYIIELLKAYLERPDAWGDDYNIPESGNGTPDILDETRWGLDFLLRMQNEDGSVLSIVGLSHASPPSTAVGPSLYGPANTSATQNASAAFALASKVFRSIGDQVYAEKLVQSAEKAWDWSEANPKILFRNNDVAYGSQGLGAGQQEEDDYGRIVGRISAACFLFDATGKTKYRDYFDAHYMETHLFQYSFAYPFESAIQDVLLYYTAIPQATGTVATAIRNKYRTSMNSTDNFSAYYNKTDPYMAHLKDYTWGSNGVKARQGLMFYNMIHYQLDASKYTDAQNAAAGYIHYLHGLNPLNMVYLSNMYRYGGDHCVNEFYHTWFTDGSPLWDRNGVSVYGPPPGFLTGGPNPSYDWDACCPSGCGSAANNGKCLSENNTPPKGQPAQKSYKDFNTGWPLNSWSVTENSGGYQVPYIRLLSKFVDFNYDCNEEAGGTAWIDACGNCVGGSTGREPAESCEEPVAASHPMEDGSVQVFPNPNTGDLYISGLKRPPYKVEIIDNTGRAVMTAILSGDGALSVVTLPQGVYILKICGQHEIHLRKVAKK